MDPLEELIRSGDPTGLDTLFPIERHLDALREDVSLLILEPLDGTVKRIQNRCDEAAAKIEEAEALGEVEGRAQEQRRFCCNWALVELHSRFFVTLNDIALSFSGLVARRDSYREKEDSETERLNCEYKDRFGMDLFTGPHLDRLHWMQLSRNLIVHEDGWANIPIPIEGQGPGKSKVRSLMPECVRDGRIAITHEVVRQVADNIIDYVDWLLNHVKVTISTPPVHSEQYEFPSLTRCWQELKFHEQGQRWGHLR
jgi:hypothetical protein